MPFKLTKDELAKRAELVDDLQTLRAKLEDELAVYNEKLAELREPLEKVQSDYNEAVAAARDFVADIVSQADSDISDKSEKWQEGERGQAASNWRDEWENASLDDLEIEWPDELQFDMPEDATTLEELNECPSD